MHLLHTCTRMTTLPRLLDCNNISPDPFVIVIVRPCSLFSQRLPFRLGRFPFIFLLLPELTAIVYPCPSPFSVICYWLQKIVLIPLCTRPGCRRISVLVPDTVRSLSSHCPTLLLFYLLSDLRRILHYSVSSTQLLSISPSHYALLLLVPMNDLINYRMALTLTVVHLDSMHTSPDPYVINSFPPNRSRSVTRFLPAIVCMTRLLTIPPRARLNHYTVLFTFHIASPQVLNDFAFRFLHLFYVYLCASRVNMGSSGCFSSKLVVSMV